MVPCACCRFVHIFLTLEVLSASSVNNIGHLAGPAYIWMEYPPGQRGKREKPHVNQKSVFWVLAKIQVVSLFPFLPEMGAASGLEGRSSPFTPPRCLSVNPRGRSEYFWNFDMELIYGRVQFIGRRPRFQVTLVA